MVAVTADTVAVNMVANTQQYDTAMAKTSNTFNTAIAGIARSAAVFAAGGAIGYGLLMLNRGFRSLANEGIVIGNSLRIAGLEGAEFNRVQQELFQIATRNAAPVKDLAQLYGRMALAQKELNANSDEMLGVTNSVAQALRISGRTAEEARGALIQLSQALGNGVVRAEEFNSITEGLLPLAQAAAAGLEEAGGSVAKLRKLMLEGKVSSEAFFRAIEAGSYVLEEKLGGASLTTEQAYTQMRNAAIAAVTSFDELVGVTDGTIWAMGQFTTALDLMADGFDWVGRASTSAGEYIDSLKQKFQEWRESAGVEDFFRRFGLNLFGQNGFTPPRPGEAPTTGWGAMTRRERVSLRDFAPPPGRGSGRKRENPYDREVRQLQESIRSRELELQLIGKSQIARDRDKAILELENAARQQGITLTAQQRVNMVALADSYAQAAQRVREAEEVQRGWIALQEEFGNAAINAIDGLISGTKDLNQVLSETLRNLAKMALQAAILGQGPLAGILGTSGVGSGSGIGGFVGALFGGFRAGGGSVSGGRAYVVGEKGPEMFVPGRNGMIVPNSALSQGTPQGGANIILNNDFRDSSAQAIAATNARLDRLERNLPQIIQQTQRSQRLNQPFYGS